MYISFQISSSKRNAILGGALGLSLFLICCKTESSPGDNRKGVVLATYEDKSLSWGEVETFFPKELSGQDSVAYVQVLIQDWLTNQAIETQVKDLIPDFEQQIAPELEKLKAGLVRKAFGEYVVRERLDTTLEYSEIAAYYERHPEKFSTKATLFQYFHIATLQKNPAQVAAWLKSDDAESQQKLSDWARQYALEFRLDSSFVTENELQRVGESYYGNLSKIRPQTVITFTEKKEKQEVLHFFKLIQVIRPEEQLPLSACKEKIRMFILTMRKNALIEEAEKELLQKVKR